MLMTGGAEGQMHERPPSRTIRLADQVHAGLMRELVALARITRDTRADDVFPSRHAATLTGDDVIEIQIVAVKNFAAVLAGIFVTLENIVPREFDLFLRQAIKQEQHNHARNADFEGNGMHHLRFRFALGKVAPASKVVSEKVVCSVSRDNLGVPLTKQRKGAADGAYVDRLPEPIEHKNLPV